MKNSRIPYLESDLILENLASTDCKSETEQDSEIGGFGSDPTTQIPMLRFSTIDTDRRD